MENLYFFIKYFARINMQKIRTVFFFSIMLFALSLTAQVPYTPFPKNLTYNFWGESYEVWSHHASFEISSKDTIIDGNQYTKITGFGSDFLAGIREENKKVFIYAPEVIPWSTGEGEPGEYLLYDFNLEIGDTIFYDIGLLFGWCGFSFIPYRHHAVVIDKGAITLNNGSIRNTFTLAPKGEEWELLLSLQWVEGLGAINTKSYFSNYEVLGLFDPLLANFPLDGSFQRLMCIDENNDTGVCLMYLYDGWPWGEEIPNSMFCTCNPGNSIIENGENEITLYPNPTTGELIIDNGQLTINIVELFDVFGRNLLTQNTNHSPQTVLSIAHLSAGVYLVKIHTEKGEVMRKVLKE